MCSLQGIAASAFCHPVCVNASPTHLPVCTWTSVQRSNVNIYKRHREMNCYQLLSVPGVFFTYPCSLYLVSLYLIHSAFIIQSFQITASGLCGPVHTSCQSPLPTVQTHIGRLFTCSRAATSKEEWSNHHEVTGSEFIWSESESEFSFIYFKLGNFFITAAKGQWYCNKQ